MSLPYKNELSFFKKTNITIYIFIVCNGDFILSGKIN